MKPIIGGLIPGYHFYFLGNIMIIYFISALLISFALFMLGSYSTIIAIISTVAKVTAVLLMVGALILLYRRLRRTHQMPKLPWLSDK